MATSSPRTDGRDESNPGGFVAAARVVAGLTIVSRVAGLARDAVCSRAFGAGAEWSAFALAFLIPNLFRRLFGEGALAAAFLPQYASLVETDPTLARRFASATFALLLLTLGVLTVLAEAVLLLLLVATPLGDSGGFVLRLTMIMLPYMPLICATAIVGGMLQTHGRFAPTAAAPVLLNLCIIGAATTWAWGLDASLEQSAVAVSVSVVLAGALQLGWALISLRRHESWTTSVRGVGAPLRALVRKALPVIVGLGALQINTLFDGLIASWPVLVGPQIALPIVGTVDYPLDEGSAAVLFFSQRLYQFPLGVFGVALATAAFPALARAAHVPDRFIATLRRSVRLSLFIGVPASVGLIVVREPLTSVILRGGQFGAEDAARVGAVLLGYAPAVWAYTLTQTLTRGFYSHGDTSTPMRVSLAMVTLNLVLNVTLIWWLGEAGLAWSTAACATIGCVWLSRLSSKYAGGPLFDSETRHGAFWAVLLSGVMGAALAGLLAALPGPTSWTHSLLHLAGLVLAGSAVFFAAALAARRPEIRWLLERGRGVEPGQPG